MTTSSSAIRSSSVISRLESSTTRVRRSPAYLRFSSASSSLMIDSTRAGLARMSSSSAMSWITERYSSSIFLRSRAARRASRMSRIAWACGSDRPNCVIRFVRAASTSSERADRLDDRVEVVERDLEALEDVGSLARLLEVELGAPADDLAAVVDVVAQDALQRQRLRLAVDQREHVEVERRLHRRVLEQVVQHLVRVRVALDLDVDPHPVAVGLVAQVRDAVDLLVLDEVRDLLEQRRLVHLVRQLGDDDRRAVVAGLLERDLRRA